MSPSSSQHSYSRVTVENESSSKETENRLIVLLIKMPYLLPLIWQTNHDVILVTTILQSVLCSRKWAE
jgi:hypothetical protein